MPSARLHPMLLRHVAVLALLLLALAPSLGWIIAAWQGSPLDRWGWVFALLAAAWWLLAVVLAEPESEPESGSATEPARPRLAQGAWPLLIAALALGIAGLVFDVRLAQAAAALGVGWALAWLLLGEALGLLLLPALLLALLALPTTGFLLERAAAAVGLAALPALALKAAAAVAVLAAGALLLMAQRRGRLPAIGAAQSAWLTGLAAAGLGLAVALHPPAFGPPLALADGQWAFGHWYGAEVPVSPSEAELFAGSRRLDKRLYAGPDGQRVSVLVVQSDDVHALHAPEYCLSGSGWRIGARAAAPSTLLPAAAAELAAARGDQRLKSVYWFSSASASTPDLAGLRLKGRGAADEPFTLYMVTAVTDAATGPDAVLASFLREAPRQ